jgi:hypothetical protein
MIRISGCGRVVATLLALLGSARAFDLSDLDVAVRLWAAPEGSRTNHDSPFAPAAELAQVGGERGRGEADLRLRRGGLAAELSARAIARAGEKLHSQGLVNELFYEADVLGQHLTLGKKVMSWDVGFGYRPLDVVQQEDRRALRPFALEGVPLLAWELFGEEWALTLLYANPLRGRAPAPRDDESAALRHYRKLGAVDVHLVARYSERTQVQAGTALVVVLGDAVELHASARYQRRSERFAGLAAGELLAASDPTTAAVSADVVAALVGFTITPGLGLSILGEAWLDPAGSGADEWRALAGRQRALLGDASFAAAAVLANLAWEQRAFDRQNLLRENLFLRASWKGERLEPAVDLLCTPEDGGWVATAAVSYQGERTRLEGGLRLFGGPPGSAYRLFPESAIFYGALQVFF